MIKLSNRVGKKKQDIFKRLRDVSPEKARLSTVPLCELVFSKQAYSSPRASAAFARSHFMRLLTYLKIGKWIESDTILPCKRGARKNDKVVEKVTNDKLQHCFDQWKALFQRYIARGEKYVGWNTNLNRNCVCNELHFQTSPVN